MLTHLIETQGRVGGLEPGLGRRMLSKWKLGQNCKDLERQDREVRLDAERRLGRQYVVTWSPDAKSLGSGSDDKTVRITGSGVHRWTSKVRVVGLGLRTTPYPNRT
jgi:hypothetical protein